MSEESEGHRPTRSTDLGALQGLMFEELDNLMSLDMTGDPDRIAAPLGAPEAAHVPRRWERRAGLTWDEREDG